MHEFFIAILVAFLQSPVSPNPPYPARATPAPPGPAAPKTTGSTSKPIPTTPSSRSPVTTVPRASTPRGTALNVLAKCKCVEKMVQDTVQLNSLVKVGKSTKKSKKGKTILDIGFQL